MPADPDPLSVPELNDFFGTIELKSASDGLVLVIDDSNTIRRSAELFLRQAGYEVILAEDGFDALAPGQKVNFEIQRDPRVIAVNTSRDWAFACTGSTSRRRWWRDCGPSAGPCGSG